MFPQGQSPMSKRKPQQLKLNVKLFNVRAEGLFEIRIQAASPAAAKYRYFKLAREAGYVSQFCDFLRRGLKAVELHQP